MDILFEKEICSFLEIPSVPLKEWNKKDSFKFGVAVTNLIMERQAYAVCSYDAEEDSEPRIIKSFAQEPFYGIDHIYVVPSFMDKDVINMDLDEESKVAAERLVQEAQELVEDNAEVNEEVVMPSNEYSFDHIHNDEEAIAFISSYNRRNNIKGNIPKKHDTLVMRLAVIHADMQKRNGTK